MVPLAWERRRKLPVHFNMFPEVEYYQVFAKISNSTAEACSYAFKKPLFPITCGDLGIEPQQVEETLSELFRLANLWDCILLFDEAEIFLSTREKRDDNLQRNALVSSKHAESLTLNSITNQSALSLPADS